MALTPDFLTHPDLTVDAALERDRSAAGRRAVSSDEAGHVRVDAHRVSAAGRETPLYFDAALEQRVTRARAARIGLSALAVVGVVAVGVLLYAGMDTTVVGIVTVATVAAVLGAGVAARAARAEWMGVDRVPATEFFRQLRSTEADDRWNATVGGTRSERARLLAYRTTVLNAVSSSDHDGVEDLARKVASIPLPTDAP